MPSPSPAHRRALALVELVVCVALVGVLVALFTLAGADARRTASLSDSLSNLRQFAWGGASFSADNAERFWSFTWRAGDTPSKYPDLAFAPTDLDAAAYQAADIIRRRHNPNFPRITQWVPHILASSLVLADHLDLKLPIPWVVSPADATRLSWQQWPNHTVPLPPGLPQSLRWIYSSSYEVGPAFWSRDQRVDAQNTIEQGSAHNLYVVLPGVTLGDRLMTQVVHPSRKAMVWESHQRFFGPRTAFYAYAEARVPVLTVDGAAGVRAATEANNGFRPNNPTSSFPTTFEYLAQSYEPPALPGISSIVNGRYRWTRGGLTGRDLGAREVCTGQPGCTP